MPDEKMPQSLAELLRQLDAQGVTDYRRYKAVRRFLTFKARDKAVPIAGSFELTPLCNLDCKMCYVHLNKEQLRGAELLSVDEWKSIMKQAVDAGMMYARVTGGECLTYPGFKELYLYLRSMGVEVTILSNGVLMDGEMLEFLKANRPAAIQITLYGASEEGYERVTGHRRFATVLHNIKQLKEAGIPVTMGITPSEFMTDGEDVLRLLHSLGLEYNINSGLMTPREDTGRALADAALDTYISMLKLQRELSGAALLPECDADELPSSGGNGEQAYGVRCGAGRSGFSVDWQGGMRPCNTFPCEPENVLKTGFAEAWRRTNAKALNYPLPAECEGCSYSGVCKHCVAEHAAGAVPGHASPLICAWGRRMIAEGLRKMQ